MRAIAYTEFGGPEVLTVVDIDRPTPGPGQVLVSVRAASVNPFDVKLRRGDMAGAFPIDFPVRPGLEVSGVVEAVGEATDPRAARVEVGDEVFGSAVGGGYAELALVASPEPKPAAVSWQVAASLPVVGEAALRALALLHLEPGETLMVLGAAGSVGLVASQVARRRGLRVIAAVRPGGEDLVRALGVEPVISGPGLAERVRALAPGGVDAVLDTAGAGLLPVAIELAGGPERVVTIADRAASELGVRFTGGAADERVPDALAQLAALAAEPGFVLPIGATYPLADAARAHADIESGAVRGKVVLLP